MSLNIKHTDRREDEKNSPFDIGAVSGRFTFRGYRGISSVPCHLCCNNCCSSQHKTLVCGDDLRSVHELQDFNVLQLSVLHYGPVSNHTLYGRSVLHVDLVLPSVATV